MSYLHSAFTGNDLYLFDTVVYKRCATGRSEAHWYELARDKDFYTPRVLGVCDDFILLERVYGRTPRVDAIIAVIRRFEVLNSHNNASYETYIGNLPAHAIKEQLSEAEHAATFFHGDLSTTNCITCYDCDNVYLIDPNHKQVFGSYLTDAGKAAWSYAVYEDDMRSAHTIAEEFGSIVWLLAASEGLRVCKYKAMYLDRVEALASLYA